MYPPYRGIGVITVEDPYTVFVLHLTNVHMYMMNSNLLLLLS